jgi:putative transposase
MPLIYKSYKVELDPNNVQITNMKKNIGAARFAYNWGLKKKIEAYGQKVKTPSAIDLHKELVILKKTDIHWAYECSKCSFQEALRDLDGAFNRFFSNCKKRIKGKKGFPKFKSKKNDKQSFRLNGSITIKDNRIGLPRIGKVKLKETDYIPKDIKITQATVSRKAGRWFVSVLTEIEHKPLTQNTKVIGIDLGIKTLVTCSDGTTFNNPKALKNNLNDLKYQQRRLSKKVKGSKNYEKQKLKVQKIHYRISNIRKDSLHKATSKIINDNQVIVLEDLKVSNMMKNHKLAQANSDVGYYEFRRQIEYKAKWNNREVKFVNTFFPSTKLCSCCGHKKDIDLKERTYKCDNCGMLVDRDLNAAKNLEQFYTGSFSGINACGDERFIKETKVSKRCSSVKQESNRKTREYTIKKVRL